MTVRDAVLGVMRRFGMTRIFGNPGSTEVPFLVDLPDDFEFVLGLQEGSVVGMASGYAIARHEPSFVNLHTAPGLGNAAGAIANARDCRAPLVVVVGQQDRRQISFEPFLTGRALDRLAGEYPVWSSLPVRAQDVPGAIARGYHEAAAARGPALVVVPMGDWLEEADELAAGVPASVLRPWSVAESDLSDVAELVGSCASPVIVVGAGSDSRPGWDAVVALAERLGCWVWQEPFGGRAGFPQDHPLFAGHLPWMRRRFREKLEGHDCVLAIGTNAFRTYLFDESVALVAPGTRVAVITDDASEAHRSPCDVAVVADVAAACRALAACVPERLVVAGAGVGAGAGGGAVAGGGDGGGGAAMARPAAPPPPWGPGEPLRAGHVLAELAARLPSDTVLVEETPSSRPELHERIPARAPLGFVSNANGALGFGLAGAIGLRMGAPERPVVAVVGDGSAMYAIQSLWSAAKYSVGVLFVVMANGGYAVMDQLAAAQGGAGPWPGFGSIDIAGVSRCLGCPAVRVETYSELVSQLDEVVPGLARRGEPLVLEVAVAP